MTTSASCERRSCWAKGKRWEIETAIALSVTAAAATRASAGSGCRRKRAALPPLPYSSGSGLLLLLGDIADILFRGRVGRVRRWRLSRRSGVRSRAIVPGVAQAQTSQTDRSLACRDIVPPHDRIPTRNTIAALSAAEGI